MKKSVITAIVITLCFICIGIGVFIGRTSIPASPRSESPYYSATKPKKVDTLFDQPEFIDGKLNLNVATVENLCLLPGVGESLAKRIVEYRQTEGPFTSVEELRYVTGMGQGKISAIYDLVTVGD